MEQEEREYSGPSDLRLVFRGLRAELRIHSNPWLFRQIATPFSMPSCPDLWVVYDSIDRRNLQRVGCLRATSSVIHQSTSLFTSGVRDDWLT